MASPGLFFDKPLILGHIAPRSVIQKGRISAPCLAFFIILSCTLPWYAADEQRWAFQDGPIRMAMQARPIMQSTRSVVQPRLSTRVMSAKPDVPKKLGINGFSLSGHQDFALKHINSLMARARMPRDVSVAAEIELEPDLENLQVGDHITGTVTELKSVGASLDIGLPCDGWIHIDNLDKGKHEGVNWIGDILKVGDKVDGRIAKIHNRLVGSEFVLQQVVLKACNHPDFAKKALSEFKVGDEILAKFQGRSENNLFFEVGAMASAIAFKFNRDNALYLKEGEPVMVKVDAVTNRYIRVIPMDPALQMPFIQHVGSPRQISYAKPTVNRSPKKGRRVKIDLRSLPEKRIDPSDGNGPFTKASFIEFHGEEKGNELWSQAVPLADGASRKTKFVDGSESQ